MKIFDIYGRTNGIIIEAERKYFEDSWVGDPSLALLMTSLDNLLII
jgi:hypothetical protein